MPLVLVSAVGLINFSMCSSSITELTLNEIGEEQYYVKDLETKADFWLFFFYNFT